ncbi:MAG: flagellar export chaperone FlgN [Verrucomicrobiota bacterium]|nr:flagellar export chaperone FlgN [Verrucomicrobiota bacterium]
MIESLQNLIESLREELQQYGEMLARLDQQQDLVTRRVPDDLLQSTAEVESQSRIIQNARQLRLQWQREVARALRLPADAPFTEITPLLPENYRPLMAALVQENNELLARVQQRSRQNHVLLSRSLELMSGLIRSLIPGGSPVYTGAGTLRAVVMPQRAIYAEIG